MKLKIKGNTAEEVAESKKEKLMADYLFIESKREEIRRLENEIAKIRKVCNELSIEYRIESVNRVLNYIRSKEITDSKELDTLLCHCQNKLNGNIDGVEIELRWGED